MKYFIFFLSLLWSSYSLTQTMLVENPTELQRMEARGLTFSELVFGYRSSDNQKLFQNAVYKSLVNAIEQDLKELQDKDPKLGVGMKFSHRLFDIRWLKSPDARFELVSVVNRMDRAVFNPGTCGELRLIYRLSYEKKQNNTLVTSRLPMTINTVYLLPSEKGCRALAHELATVDKKVIKAWVLRKNLKAVELNLQAVRWPSTIRADMGGHAEYFLRVFKALPDGTLALSSLENTPDLELLKNPTVKNELLHWLLKSENVRALDSGTLNIPEKFLAKKVSSFALHGMNRLANRPFDTIFKKEDFLPVNYSNLKNIYGASSFRRRLNDMSCAGCHQGRTIAGFHFLGKDSEKTIFANSIFSSQSPHMVEELFRRKKYVQALLEGKTPDPSRPFSERDPNLAGKMNDHCGLGEEYQAWSCGEGFQCVPVITPDINAEIGLCFPNVSVAGNPCEPGNIVQKVNPHKDYLVDGPEMSCGTQNHCETTRVGFPGGMCSGRCENLKPGETCGAIAELAGFNNCLAKKRPFPQCLAENTRPGSMQSCDEFTSCRSDYICMKTKDNRGACIPPYFLFQLRVDGHPDP